MTIREASFALRVVKRREGLAAIIYRRSLNEKQLERLTRITSISPLSFTSGVPLLRAAAHASGVKKLAAGPYIPLDPDWGARVACFALVASGLRNSDRIHRAAEELRNADGAEAAWWFGLMSSLNGKRAVRAMRILVEAVK